MQEILRFRTTSREQVIDLTDLVRSLAAGHPEATLCSIYSQGATGAIMIQENWDPNIGVDFLDLLRRYIPQGEWLHDRVDGNADAHLKAGIVGASETIPIYRGEILLGTWQNIFFCEFDGPREERSVVVTIL